MRECMSLPGGMLLLLSMYASVSPLVLGPTRVPSGTHNISASALAYVQQVARKILVPHYCDARSHMIHWE